MSKIKDELMRIQQEEYEHYINFMEWVCDQKTEVSANEGNSAEEENTEVSSTRSSCIVPRNTLEAVNNIDYNPRINA